MLHWTRINTATVEIDLRPSHTEGTTGRRPPVTSKFSVVFSSLLMVADCHMMVLLTFRLVFADLRLIQDLATTIYCVLVVERYLVQAPKPLYDQLVFYWSATGCQLVADWSPMVFSGLRSVFYGLQLLFDGFQYTSPDTGG